MWGIFYSPYYRVFAYRNVLKLKRSGATANPLEFNFRQFEAKMKKLRNNKDSSAMYVWREFNDSWEPEVYGQLNAFYRALIEFELKKGFNSEKYKDMAI